MSNPNLDSALKFVLRWEGGFVDHPADPGGRTNRGVTQRVYDAWRRRQGLSARDVKGITDDEVHAIYADGYWVPPRCEMLMRPLDLVQFDTAVNMGVGRAVRFLQGAVGCSVDGDFGPGTEAAVSGCDTRSTLKAYCDLREAYYRRLVQQRPAMGVFLKGWLNRLNALRRETGVLPALRGGDDVDFGDERYIARVPDIGEDPTLPD